MGQMKPSESIPMPCWVGKFHVLPDGWKRVWISCLRSSACFWCELDLPYQTLRTVKSANVPWIWQWLLKSSSSTPSNLSSMSACSASRHILGSCPKGALIITGFVSLATFRSLKQVLACAWTFLWNSSHDLFTIKSAKEGELLGPGSLLPHSCSTILLVLLLACVSWNPKMSGGFSPVK